MTLLFYGENRTPQELKALTVSSDPSFAGTFFKDMVEGMANTGYRCREKYYPVTDEGFGDGLQDIINSLDAQKPVLVDTNIPPIGHTVLAIGYDPDRRRLILLDPNIESPGVRAMSYDEFKSVWYSLTAHIRGAIFTQPKN